MTKKKQEKEEGWLFGSLRESLTGAKGILKDNAKEIRKQSKKR